jgi:hypothetical protein
LISTRRTYRFLVGGRRYVLINAVVLIKARIFSRLSVILGDIFIFLQFSPFKRDFSIKICFAYIATHSVVTAGYVVRLLSLRSEAIAGIYFGL